MKTAQWKGVVYLFAGSILLTGLLWAQQGSRTGTKKSQTKAAASKPEPRGTSAEVDITKCEGGDVEASNQITFKAVDHPYNVVIIDKSVFTDCESILNLIHVGDTHTCTANTVGLNPGQHRQSEYFVIPPHGLKQCPKGITKPGKRVFTPGDPNDITVP